MSAVQTWRLPRQIVDCDVEIIATYGARSAVLAAGIEVVVPTTALVPVEPPLPPPAGYPIGTRHPRPQADDPDAAA